MDTRGVVFLWLVQHWLMCHHTFQLIKLSKCLETRMSLGMWIFTVSWSFTSVLQCYFLKRNKRNAQRLSRWLQCAHQVLSVKTPPYLLCAAAECKKKKHERLVSDQTCTVLLTHYSSTNHKSFQRTHLLLRDKKKKKISRMSPDDLVSFFVFFFS